MNQDFSCVCNYRVSYGGIFTDVATLLLRLLDPMALLACSSSGISISDPDLMEIESWEERTLGISRILGISSW